VGIPFIGFSEKGGASFGSVLMLGGGESECLEGIGDFDEHIYDEIFLYLAY
jgi:hypothetical protein